jgi:drug/metabolite transporter (DMT)-like permease
MPPSRQEQPASEGSGLKERLGGVVALLAGAALAYWCVYEPLEAAARHEPEVSVYLKGAVLCPIAMIGGAVYLILGKRAQSLFGTREHPSSFAWVFGVVLALAGFGLYFWLKSTLEGKGYKF